MRPRFRAPRDAQPDRLKEPIRFWFALPIVTLTALAAVLGMGALAWWAVGSPSFGRRSDGLETFLDALRISLSVIAGIGGVIALLVAYRRQRYGEIAEHRANRAEEREDTKLLHERFTKAVEQLGHDSPAVRLGGVHALATVADDWDSWEDRQMCIDVLCSYLRMDVEPDTENEPDAHAAWRARREVRHTILRTIAAHLRPDGSTTNWQGHHFDLRGITLDLDLNLQGAQFPENTDLDLGNAVFSSGCVDFHRAKFSDGRVNFAGAQFSGGKVNFLRAQFSGGQVNFDEAEFIRGLIDFHEAQFGPEFRFVGHARGSADVIQGLPVRRLTLTEADDQTEDGSDASD